MNFPAALIRNMRLDRCWHTARPKAATKSRFLAPLRFARNDRASKMSSECPMGPRPTQRDEHPPTCHSERSEESAFLRAVRRIWILVAQGDYNPRFFVGEGSWLSQYRLGFSA